MPGGQNPEPLQETPMSLAVQIRQPGGPEELQLVDVPVGEPGPGEIRIRHQAIGLNFIDVYQRTGLYPNPLPLTLGMEGAGVVEAVGEGVTHLKVPRRPRRLRQPAARQLLRGARDAGQVRVQAARRDRFETGAAMMLKGLTAQYLLKKTLPSRACSRATSCCSMPPPAAWA
jgi:NADPH2:quinone reductase